MAGLFSNVPAARKHCEILGNHFEYKFRIMKKAIELADTTFRAYRKGNGGIILHLRTHLIVYADADFRTKIKNAWPSLKWDEPRKPSGLSVFMKESPRCWLKFSNTKQFECEISYACFPEARSIEHPTGDG
jgi:hypothetical protein